MLWIPTCLLHMLLSFQVAALEHIDAPWAPLGLHGTGILAKVSRNINSCPPHLTICAQEAPMRYVRRGSRARKGVSSCKGYGLLTHYGGLERGFQLLWEFKPFLTRSG